MGANAKGMCGSDLRTSATVAGVSAVLQSCVGIGLNIFFVLYFFSPDSIVQEKNYIFSNGTDNISIPIKTAPWMTLELATDDGYLSAIQGITIGACVFNLIWLISTIAHLIGNEKKNHVTIQAWVFVTAFNILYDAIGTIAFLSTTVDLRKVKISQKDVKLTPENLQPYFQADYTLYIVEILGFSRLGPITLIFNAICCYYAQRRIFEILKSQRSKEDVLAKPGTDLLNGRKGKGVYREESIPNGNQNWVTRSNDLELMPRQQFRQDGENRRRNTIEEDYRDDNMPRNGLLHNPQESWSTPYPGTNQNNQRDEMEHLDHRMNRFESDLPPGGRNFDRQNTNDGNRQPAPQRRSSPVQVAPPEVAPPPGVYGQPREPQNDRQHQGLRNEDARNRQDPSAGRPQYPQTDRQYPGLRNEDPRNRQDPSAARPHAPQPVKQNYLKPVEEQRSVQRSSPAPPSRYNKTYVPTPFIPPADYNGNVSDSDDERSGYDNQGYEDDGRHGYPEQYAREQDPRQNGQAGRHNRAQIPLPNVAQMRNEVERNNSNRKPGPPPRLARHGSNRSVQSDRPNHGNGGQPQRPTRVLPEGGRRPQNHFPEEDERFYRQQPGNARNYDSDPDYRPPPRGYPAPEARSRF